MLNPETEYQKEIEFRSKVYKMLSMGLSHTEIESVLRTTVDWSLFSMDTLQDIIDEQKAPIVVSVPKEVFPVSNVDAMARRLENKLSSLAEMVMACTILSISSFILISVCLWMMLK